MRFRILRKIEVIILWVWMIGNSEFRILKDSYKLHMEAFDTISFIWKIRPNRELFRKSYDIFPSILHCHFMFFNGIFYAKSYYKTRH